MSGKPATTYNGVNTNEIWLTVVKRNFLQYNALSTVVLPPLV